MSDYTFDQRCLQTMALVAWVRQKAETWATMDKMQEQFINYNALCKAWSMDGIDTVERFRAAWMILVVSDELSDIYNAAVAGNDHEYLRLLSGYPSHYAMSKMRVFVDNAHADWTFASSRPTNDHRRLWKEMGS